MMKFWQYIVGVGLAILIFSGAVFSEYSGYQRVSFLEKNPFSLMGETNYSENGYDDFLSTDGGFVRTFNGAIIEELEYKNLISGELFLGGTFFGDDTDDSIINKIKFGDLILDYSASNVVIKRDSDKQETKILNYGRTVELYFLGEAEPFLIPSEMMIEIKDMDNFPKSKHYNFYEYSKLFNLSSIDWVDKLSDDLKKGVEDLYILRNSFFKFATKIPLLWEKNGLNILDVNFPDENNTKEIEINKLLETLFKVKELISKSDTFNKGEITEILRNFRLNLLKKDIKSELRKNDTWNLFEKSQKIWLPTVTKERAEWAYRLLWESQDEGLAKLEKILNISEFFSFNMNADLIENELLKMKNDLKEIDYVKVENKFKLSSLRRRIYFLLKNQLIKNGSIKREVIDLYYFLAQKELIVYEKSEFLKQIKEEIVRNTINSIGIYIDKKEDSARVLVRISIGFLEKNIDLYDFVEKNKNNLDKKELEIIEDIKLVGVSGLTPKEVKTLNYIKDEELRLDKLIDKNEKYNEKVEESREINSSKKLWRFLKSQNINININKFRTKHDALTFETSFENTEEGKRKIAGLFDYKGQMFKKLTLGEASRSKLLVNSLSIWIKSIEGKFEPMEVVEKEEKSEKDLISQNSRKAITNRQFLSDLLASFNLNVSKSNIEIISKDLNTLHAKDVKLAEDNIKNKSIFLDYDMVENKFNNIYFEDAGEKTYLSKFPIKGNDLHDIVFDELKIKKSD